MIHDTMIRPLRKKLALPSADEGMTLIHSTGGFL